MSRTLAGNLTGKAAQLERADVLEAAMDRTPFARRWGNAVDDLRELMGEDKFDEWFDSYPVDIPKGQFILVMEAQLKNLTVTEEDAGEIHAHLLTVDRNPVETAYALEFLTDSEDPRTERERDWDDHCAEVQATRESDMPRGW